MAVAVGFAAAAAACCCCCILHCFVLCFVLRSPLGPSDFVLYTTRYDPRLLVRCSSFYIRVSLQKHLCVSVCVLHLLLSCVCVRVYAIAIV